MMCEESFVSEEEKMDLFRNNLIEKHLQEVKDHSVAQVLASQHLHRQHLQEMSQISMLFNPINWVLTIRHYTRQLIEVASVDKFTRNSMKERQQKDVIALDHLIERQKLFLKDAQRSDMLFMDRFNELFDWSFSEIDKHFYHQALHHGYSLVLTDITQSILWVSQAFETMTGYQLTEVTGRNAWFLQGETTDQVILQYVREHLNQALEVEADLINYHKRGDAYLCHLHIKLLRNRGGELTHFIAIENEVDMDPQRQRENYRADHRSVIDRLPT